MKKPLALLVIAIFAACLIGLTACSDVSDEAFSDGAATVSTRLPVNSPSLRVSFIDVGKGDCILVQSGNGSVLIDAGYEKTAGDVASYLQEEGVDRLDALIVTHYDRDHVGGIEAIGREVPIDTVYLPGYEGSDENYRSCTEAVKALGAPSKQVTKELTLDLGDARLTVFPSGVVYKPGTDGSEGNDNDASLISTLVYGQDTYLFAGDLEEDGIDAYLSSQHGQFDVLKMPHHGRRSSNTDDFINDVHPQIAIITDSKKEPADKKIRKLLKSADVELYCTGVDGTVVVESNGNGKYSVVTLDDR